MRRDIEVGVSEDIYLNGSQNVKKFLDRRISKLLTLFVRDCRKGILMTPNDHTMGISLSSGVLSLSLLLGLLARFAGVVSANTNTTSPIYRTTLIPIKDNVYGARNVSYWVSDDGLAIIDGDVALDSTQLLSLNCFAALHVTLLSPSSFETVNSQTVVPPSRTHGTSPHSSSSLQRLLKYPLLLGAIIDETPDTCLVHVI